MLIILTPHRRLSRLLARRDAMIAEINGPGPTRYYYEDLRLLQLRINSHLDRTRARIARRCALPYFEGVPSHAFSDPFPWNYWNREYLWLTPSRLGGELTTSEDYYIAFLQGNTAHDSLRLRPRPSGYDPILLGA